MNPLHPIRTAQSFIKRAFWALCTVACLISPLFAEVTTDGTLGPQADLAGPDFAITSDLGQTHGANLFHSFQNFNLRQGESATFSGPPAIENIISRVTGGTASHIDGTIRSEITGANLFLLNPFGILFGPNAALDLTGSFYAGTADCLRFDDGSTFYANPANESVLSVARPEAFGFLTDNPAAITLSFDGTNFRGAENGSVSLVAGDIAIDGGESGSSIQAGKGLQIVGVGQAGDIHLASPSLLAGPDAQSGHVSITNTEISTGTDATGTAMEPGSVIIRGGRILLSNASVTAANSTDSDSTAPGIDVAAVALDLDNQSSLVSSSFGSGGGSEVRIEAHSLSLDGESIIGTETLGSGKAGDLSIKADVDLDIRGTSLIGSTSSATGDAGSIFIDAESVLMDNSILVSHGYESNSGNLHVRTTTFEMRNDSSISASPQISGNGGNIDIAAAGNIRIDESKILAVADMIGTITIKGDRIQFNASKVSSLGSMEQDSVGTAIDIQATTQIDLSGSEILDLTDGQSKGGDLRLTAGEINLMDEAIVEVGALDQSTTGDIEIKAYRLNLEGASSIQSIAKDSGVSGDIGLNVTDKVTFRNASFIGAASSGTGSAGNIRIRAKSMSLENGSSIYGHTRENGVCGSIVADIAQDVSVSDSVIEIYASDQSTAVDVRIGSKQLSLTNGAVIKILASVEGQAGSVYIDTAETLSLSGASSLYTGALDQGRSGNIEISANVLTVQNDSCIQALSEENGVGGSVLIEATNAVIVKGDESLGITSHISSETAGASSAGGLEIHTGYLEVVNAGIGSISEENGKPGAVAIDAENIFMDTGNILSGSVTSDCSNISIKANTIKATNDSSVSAFSLGDGNSGAIDIIAESIHLDNGAGISTLTKGAGQGGSLSIDTKYLIMQNDSSIGADTAGEGDGGPISIIASESIHLNSDAMISTMTMGSGKSNNLSIFTGQLTMQNGSVISTATGGEGDGGSIDLHVDGDMYIQEAWLTTSVLTKATAEGGDIHVSAANLHLQNGAKIYAKSKGAGRAGNVTFDAALDFTAEEALVNTEALQADGGNITVNAGRAVLLIDSRVTTSVNGGPGTAGGNINLYAKQVILAGESQLEAKAYEGRGGDINITADTYLAEPSSVVDASSERGIDGPVNIRAPFGNLSGSLKPLPKEFLNAAKLVKEPCEARLRGGHYSSFTVRGRDALPAEPGALQMSPPVDF